MNGNIFNRERDMNKSLKEDCVNVCVKRNVTSHKKEISPTIKTIYTVCMFVFYLGVSLHCVDPSETEVFSHWDSVMSCLFLLLLLLLLLPLLQLLLWPPITTTTAHNHNYNYCNLTSLLYLYCICIFGMKWGVCFQKNWMGRPCVSFGCLFHQAKLYN